METEFSNSDLTLSFELIKKNTMNFKKFIAWFLSFILIVQLSCFAAGSYAPRSAYAATIGKGVVCESVYGVRADGVTIGWTITDPEVWEVVYQVMNPQGEVVFSDKDDYHLDFKSGQIRDLNYLNGNIIVEKNHFTEEDADGNRDIEGIEYGLLDPKTGDMAFELAYYPNELHTWVDFDGSAHSYYDYSAYDKFIEACNAKGFCTELKSDNEWMKIDDKNSTFAKNNKRWANFICTLPTGNDAYSEWQEAFHQYVVVNEKGERIQIAGYDYGCQPCGKEWGEPDLFHAGNNLFRTNNQGSTIYYVTNSTGKVGAVKEDGTVVIPFEYDAYYDAKQGSDLILLKKNGTWNLFDLNSVGYGSSGKPSVSTPGSIQPSTPDLQPTAKTGIWIRSGNRWWYQYSDGTYPKDWTCVDIDGKTYRFDEEGWMRTGWIKENGRWYYHNSSGALQTDWLKDRGLWYYLDPAEKGAMKENCFYQVRGKTYSSDGNGVMRIGWHYLDGKWYHFKWSGEMSRGWIKQGRTWYYLDSDGVMQVGKKKIDGVWYYLDISSGAMNTGWNKEGDQWFYYSPSGAMMTGWVKSGGRWYYLDLVTGAMQVNWLYPDRSGDGNTYFLYAADGRMLTGWVRIDYVWYYFNNSGAMQRNTWVGNYYVGENGGMVTNTWIGKWHVNDQGVWDQTDPYRI